MSNSFESRDALEGYEALTARRLRMLDELARMGLEMAEALLQRSAAPALPGDEPVDVAFERISRAVRMSLTLRARLEAELARTQAKASARAQTTTRPPPARSVRMLDRIRARRGEARKAAAGEIAEAAILARAAVSGARIDVAQLKARLAARLDDRSDAVAFADAPLAELAQRLCRQIGFRFDVRLWSEDEWLASAVKDASPPSRR